MTATLECTGNGRGFYTPKVPGIQWGRGAVGNAEWRGPKLSDVLKLAGVDPEAAHIEIDGADTGVVTTPDFVRSMPMAKALHPATLLALSMNSESPEIHGFPVRLVVPGWDGTSWVKWVTRLTPAARREFRILHEPGYRYPKYALPPGAPAKPGGTGSDRGHAGEIHHHCARRPEQGSAMGTVSIRGFAWAGEEAIERVEVSTDGGSRWRDAELPSPKLPFAWRLWRLDWRPAAPGYYTILSRATDSAGRVQPFVAGVEPVGIFVERHRPHRGYRGGSRMIGPMDRVWLRGGRTGAGARTRPRSSAAGKKKDAPVCRATACA